MSDENTMHILCMLVSEGPAHVDSVTKECADCNVEIFVALSTLAGLSEEHPDKQVVFLCAGCALVRWRGEEEPPTPQLLGEQERELRPLIGDERMDRIKRLLFDEDEEA